MTTWSQKCATLTLITGPMFAGKTGEMVMQILHLQHGKRRAAILLYADDDRFSVGDAVATHDYPALPALAPSELLQVVRGHTLAEAVAKLDGGVLPEIVGIDEGQMFPDLASAAVWADRGICVFVAALNSDFRRRPFAQVAALAPDLVISRTAECMECHHRAGTSTYRIVASTDLLLIGGSDCYRALCRLCYMLKAPPAARD